MGVCPALSSWSKWASLWPIRLSSGHYMFLGQEPAKTSFYYLICLENKKQTGAEAKIVFALCHAAEIRHSSNQDFFRRDVDDTGRPSQEIDSSTVSVGWR